MSFNYTADEILEMALQIERNGVAFYRQAAEQVADQTLKKLLTDLANMEVGHERIFSEMKADLSRQEKAVVTFDPNGESVQYLQALADTRVFFQKEIDLSSPGEIFKAAIVAEKDSIMFYLGMKDLVPENLGRGRIDGVIDEEKRHIHILSRELVASQK